MPADQRKAMRMTMIVSPVMILFFTISTSAGLGLYFFIGGIFACVQTLIINLYRPRIRREIEAEMKKNPPKVVKPKPVVAAQPAATAATTPKPSTVSQDKRNRNRNAGKQRHH